MLGLGFWETVVIIPMLLIGLSPAWFAFTKSKRVRWMLVIGWWVVGLLFAFGNLGRMKGHPLPIVLIGYPIGVVIGLILWAGVYKVIGWLCVRIWRFFRKWFKKKED